MTAGVAVRSHVPGRLRLTASRAVWAGASARAEALVASGDATAVSANRRTGSILIQFEPGSDAVARSFGLSTVQPPRPPAASNVWRVEHTIAGRVRLRNELIRRSAGAAAAVDAFLLNLGGVRAYTVSRFTGGVTVSFDEAFLTREELLELLAAVLDLAAEHKLAMTVPPLDPASLRLSLSTATVALSVGAWIFPPLALVCATAVAIAAGRIFADAARALVIERKTRVELLDATVIVIALVHRRFFPAAFIVWVFDVSNALLSASSKASHKRLSEIFGRQTRKATLLRDGEEIEVAVSELAIGDRILVRAGDQVPVDGTVVDGAALIDEAALTGEHAPAEKCAGDSVMAMSVALAGRAVIEAARTGRNTNASRMVGLIESSLDHKLRIQTMAERFADGMVVPTLGLGAVGYSLTGANAMMAIVNADYGTGIRISGPLALLESVSAAAKSGILVKKGRTLESLHKMRAVVFDKTGTLTDDVPAIGRTIVLDPAFSEEEIFTLAASAEQRFTHPIARALLRRASEQQLCLRTFDDADYHVGFGVQVRIGTSVLRVGSSRYLARNGIAVAATAPAIIEDIHARGGSALLVAIDSRHIGIVELEAAPRAEARHLVDMLREKRGIEEIHLVSGDHTAPTRALARRLGIEKFNAEVLPADKATIVRGLQERGLKVAMIGDGINDTVGLAQADYSISLRGAADAATDIADIVLMDGNLAKLELLLEISDNLHTNVRRSFALALYPNSLLMIGALAGRFGLGTSLLFNNVFNLIATMNGLQAQKNLSQPSPSE